MSQTLPVWKPLIVYRVSKSLMPSQRPGSKRYAMPNEARKTLKLSSVADLNTVTCSRGGHNAG